MEKRAKKIRLRRVYENKKGELCVLPTWYEWVGIALMTGVGFAGLILLFA